MRLDEEIKTKVLDIFVPKVNYFGKTNVKWNEYQIPHPTDILYFIYHHFDVAMLHCCKQFQIHELPSELNDEIMSYLNPQKPSLQSIYTFWYWMYLENLHHLYYKDECQLRIYKYDYQYRYYLTCVRLYRIQEKISWCYDKI